MTSKYILAIESSCDDSAIGLMSFDTCKAVFQKKLSQESWHNKYGGVVPELASRLFAKDLPMILQDLYLFMESRGISFDEILAIAVTNEPGLSTSLLEGIMLAKSISIIKNIPLIAINHLIGHIYSLFINKDFEAFPLSVLLVSGGHTMLLESRGYFDIKLVSKSLDDSFGESYDKVSKMLGYGYPGGQIVDALASKALKLGVKKIDYPIALLKKDTLDFSFSGLKNAVRLSLDSKDTKPLELACSLGFQYAAVQHLVNKLRKYLLLSKQGLGVKNFAIVGGGAANSYLREQISLLATEFKFNYLKSELEFCSDNANMIARACRAKILDTSKKFNLSLEESVKKLNNLGLQGNPSVNFDKI